MLSWINSGGLGTMLQFVAPGGLILCGLLWIRYGVRILGPAPEPELNGDARRTAWNHERAHLSESLRTVLGFHAVLFVALGLLAHGRGVTAASHRAVQSVGVLSATLAAVARTDRRRMPPALALATDGATSWSPAD